VNESSSYILPAVKDIQNNAPITVSLVSPTPPFVTIDTAMNIITFNPTWPVDIGNLQTIAVQLSDATTASRVVTFQISILNHPPRYVDASFLSYPDITVAAND
jgi:hypothetical protein